MSSLIHIRPAEESDLSAYTDLLQRTFEHTYAEPSLGLTPERFSREIFLNDETQAYLRSNLKNTTSQACWLAFAEHALVGSLTVSLAHDVAELKGFYVDPSHQGQGIGTMLWNKALEYMGHRQAIADTYAHNAKALDIYRRWGFEIDTSRGEQGYFYRHWPEWPEGLQAKCVYLRRKAA